MTVGTSRSAATTTSASTIGLAARPGTAVEPTWSMRKATPATAGQTNAAIRSKAAGHAAS